jgi:hypothetical protein
MPHVTAGTSRLAVDRGQEPPSRKPSSPQPTPPAHSSHNATRHISEQPPLLHNCWTSSPIV